MILKKTILLVLAISLLLLSGCMKYLPAEQAAPELTASLDINKISLAVLDKRPYVVNGKKSESFEGLIRSGYGIPYSHNTQEAQPMSEYLAHRISIGFKNKGVETGIIKTEPGMNVNEVITNLLIHKSKSLLFVLNEWKYDFHSFADAAWYDVNIIVVDKFGKQILTKKFEGKDNVPDTASMVLLAPTPISIANEMQAIYKQRFETMLSDSEVIEALKK